MTQKKEDITGPLPEVDKKLAQRLQDVADKKNNMMANFMDTWDIDILGGTNEWKQHKREMGVSGDKRKQETPK